MEKISCYCQNCSAENNIGETNCRRCGTRLLLIVLPPSLKYDTNHVPSFYEDHLLERVSLLELRLVQIVEQLAMAFEIIKRESKAFENDHALLQSFFETIEKVNPDLSTLLKESPIESPGEKKENPAYPSNREQIFKEILAHHTNPNVELFTHLIKEGVKLLANNEERQAFRHLERAALLSPRNVPLKVFIAEKLFRADKFEAAEKYLKTAFETEPQNEKILLLLGTIYADFADAEKSRKLLSVLIIDPNKALCVNYIWGILAAFEAHWTESIAAFKEAVKIEEVPEIHYLIGCAYFESNNYKLALRYFQKANSIDSKFTDAWFMQSLVYEILNDVENEKKARLAALDSKEAGAQCLKFLSGGKQFTPEIALPFTHFKKAEKHLLTAGSLRLIKFFREQIFKSIE
ncbi:MAG: tetratricopeptide repeat protein [Acidobacteria bacterium]|nr:tetratricopeptide repeat protein [Acidobacteriota bacterium]